MRTHLAVMLAILIAAGVAGEARAEKRIALVIGDGSHAHISPLTIPKFDAEVKAQTMGDVGFDVALATDADRRAMIRSIQTALSKVGCNPGAIDGNWGRRSQNALEQFAKHANVTLPSELVSPETLKLFERRQGRVCQVTQRTTVPRKQQQPAKTEQKKKRSRRSTCPKGHSLDASGNCVGPGVGNYYYDCEFKSDGC